MLVVGLRRRRLLALAIVVVVVVVNVCGVAATLAQLNSILSQSLILLHPNPSHSFDRSLTRSVASAAATSFAHTFQLPQRLTTRLSNFGASRGLRNSPPWLASLDLTRSNSVKSSPSPRSQLQASVVSSLSSL